MFTRQHPAFYSDSNTGGWRNSTVHVELVPMAHEGYVPPPGNAANIHFRERPKLIPQQTGGNLVINFVPYYYVEYQGRLQRVIDVLYEHFYVLHAFLTGA